MPRNVGTIAENNFSKGLITEATGLNFPENACTDTDNCVFRQIGQVHRRLGLDIEPDADTLEFFGTEGVVTEYLWRSVALSGAYVFLVMQIGDHVTFMEMSASGSISSNIKSFAVNLLDYTAPGAGIIRYDPCTFASGNGRLFIAHPKCDPVLVTYDAISDSIEQRRLQLKVRDFEGIDDGNPIDFQPTALTNSHWYNLKNQGWNQQVRAGTSNASD